MRLNVMQSTNNILQEFQAIRVASVRQSERTADGLLKNHSLNTPFCRLWLQADQNSRNLMNIMRLMTDIRASHRTKPALLHPTYRGRVQGTKIMKKSASSTCRHMLDDTGVGYRNPYPNEPERHLSKEETVAAL